MRSRSSTTLAVLLAVLAVPILTACHLRIVPGPPAPAGPAALCHDIDGLLAAPALERSYWGVLVRSLANDETLCARNAGRLLMPASNMKVVTLAAAADRLGWDYTYETRLLATGPIQQGELRGDLVVVGSGDPSIGGRDGSPTRVFDEWAEQLKAQGIRRITGRIVGDDNAFDNDTLGMGWAWDDLPDGYAAGIGALQFNENAVRVTVAPGLSAGADAVVTVAPPWSGLVVDNRVKTAPAGTEGSFTSRRMPGSLRLELRGSVPLGGEPLSETKSVDNPTRFFVTALRATLIARGIDVGGPAVDIDELLDPPARPGSPPLLSHRSPPLAALAVTFMKVSQNQYGETFVKTLGASSGTPTMAAGRKAVRDTLETWGLNPAGLVNVDGSGLSRYNYVTPELLVGILTHVERDGRLRGPFKASLPVVGIDGTLARRMKGTRAEGHVHAKTGSMTGVRALSGLVQTADDESLVFSILANNYETSSEIIEKTADAIVVKLAGFSRTKR